MAALRVNLLVLRVGNLSESQCGYEMEFTLVVSNSKY